MGHLVVLLVNALLQLMNDWSILLTHHTPNVSSFYSEKDYFVLDVQVVLDTQKCVPWNSVKYKGAKNDSTAFKIICMYKTFTLN